MSYSTIMVALDLDHPNDGRMRVAGDLAERFNAKLIGIAAGDIQPLYFAEGAAAEEMLEKDRDALKAQIATLEGNFRRALKGRGKQIEWRGAVDWPADYVAREARAADLIVTGSHHEKISPFRAVNPGDLALRAGRPIFVVPPQVTRLIGKSILVAWKDTREARRAICDSLPLLHRADEVIVVELVDRDSERAAAKSRVDDVAAWLTRRGIAAASIASKALIAPSGQIEIIARDENSDVIVAGAYGHTRVREWVFGGMTRDLLTRGTRCAFLSH